MVEANGRKIIGKTVGKEAQRRGKKTQQNVVVERQQHKILIEYSLISDVHKRYFDNHQKRSLSVPSTGVLSDLENQFHRVITQLFLMMYKNGGTPAIFGFKASKPFKYLEL